MRNTPLRSLLVLLGVALVCSVLVSVSAILLRPIQQQNEMIERYRHIVSLTGLAPPGAALSGDEVLAVIEMLDVRVVNLETGEFDPAVNAASFDARAAAGDPERSVAIPDGADLARLGRRSTHQLVYLVWTDDEISRIILPIHGQGMWSTLYGLIALESDLNTVGAVTFYEQAETAGLGDQIQNADWLGLWQGRELFGRGGTLRFRVAGGPVNPDSPAARHEVDGLSGATITAAAVTALVRFWFDDYGYGPLLARIHSEPPVRATGNTGD